MYKQLTAWSVAIVLVGGGITSLTTANAEVMDVLNTDVMIEHTIKTMTLEEKIGQMMMPDFRKWANNNGSTPVNHTKLSKEVATIVNDYHLGGIILFAENVQTTEQTTTFVHQMNEAVTSDIPLFFAVDQEGGIVTRLGTGTNLPGNMAIGATRNERYAYDAGAIIGKELHALGINVNFAPVLDVNNNPANPVINVRSYSSDPELVGKLGAQTIKGIQDQGVGATAKHFPGHGDTAVDSHYGLPIVNKSIDQLREVELKPFQTAIENGLDMIMTAHIGMPQIEDETIPGTNVPIPATLSNDVIEGVLRDELQYDGVVVTDALDMKAISENFTPAEAVIKTFQAGVDIALMPGTFRTEDRTRQVLDGIYEGVKEAVATGALDEATQIDDSVERILRLKVERGIWNPTGEEQTLSLGEKMEQAKAIVGNPEHKAKEMEISNAAVTLLENDKTLPLKPKKGERVLFISTAQDHIQSMYRQVDVLKADKKLKDIEVEGYVYNGKTLHLDENAELKQKIDAADYVIVGSLIRDGSTLVETKASYYVPNEIFKYANEINKKSVLLSLRNPYDTATFNEAGAKVAVYGFKGDSNGPDSESGRSAGPNIKSGINVIFGAVTPSGILPINVPTVDVVTGGFGTEDYYDFGYAVKKWGIGNGQK